MDAGDWVAVYAAFVATIVAGVEIYKFLQSKFNLKFYLSTTSSETIGNELCIWNGSDQPVIFIYFVIEIYKLCPHGKWQYKYARYYPEEEGFANVTVEPKRIKTLMFTEQEYFSTGQKTKVEIVVHVAGRNKPIRRILWEPE